MPARLKTSPPGKSLKFTPFPDFLQEILEVGGMDPYADKMVAAGKVKK